MFASRWLRLWWALRSSRLCRRAASFLARFSLTDEEEDDDDDEDDDEEEEEDCVRLRSSAGEAA